MELTDVIRCPRTGNRLRFDDGSSVVCVEDSDVTYPVVDGIVDLCPEIHDKVTKAYDGFASRYDAYMTSTNKLLKLWEMVVWGFPGDCCFFDDVLSCLPSEFDGVLLDIPVGTGVLTSVPYAQFPDATIIAVDYSMGMLQKARKRFLEHGVTNVHLFRADVANLPVRDGAVDIVLSMNGLHAFADKRRAVSEMRRVLCENGTLIACGYFCGARKIADLFVKYFMVRTSFFTAPFFHIDSIASDFEGFEIHRQGGIKSAAWFEAVNKGKEDTKK